MLCAAAFDLSSRKAREQKPILLVKSVLTKTAVEGETETRWKRRARLNRANDDDGSETIM